MWSPPWSSAAGCDRDRHTGLSFQRKWVNLVVVVGAVENVEKCDGGRNARHRRGTERQTAPGSGVRAKGFLNSLAVSGFWMEPTVMGDDVGGTL